MTENRAASHLPRCVPSAKQSLAVLVTGAGVPDVRETPAIASRVLPGPITAEPMSLSIASRPGTRNRR